MAAAFGLPMRSPLTWAKLVVFAYILHTMWHPIVLPTTPVAQAVWVMAIVVASSMDMVLAIMLTVALIVSLTAKPAKAAAEKYSSAVGQAEPTEASSVIAEAGSIVEADTTEPFKPMEAEANIAHVDEGENLFPYPESILEPRLADVADVDKDIEKLTEVSRHQLLGIQTNVLVPELVDMELEPFQPVGAPLVLEVSPLAHEVSPLAQNKKH